MNSYESCQTRKDRDVSQILRMMVNVHLPRIASSNPPEPGVSTAAHETHQYSFPQTWLGSGFWAVGSALEIVFDCMVSLSWRQTLLMSVAVTTLRMLLMPLKLIHRDDDSDVELLVLMRTNMMLITRTTLRIMKVMAMAMTRAMTMMMMMMMIVMMAMVMIMIMMMMMMMKEPTCIQAHAWAPPSRKLKVMR